MPIILDDWDDFTQKKEINALEKMEKDGDRARAGNTNLTAPLPNKRVSPSKIWCFTYNNPNEKFMEVLMNNYRVVKYVFQLEEGKSGTRHFQGCVKFDCNTRPCNLFGPDWNAIHWEKCSNWEASVRYCQKKEGRVRGPWLKGENKIEELNVLQFSELKDWQKNICNILEGEKDPRKIYWFWDALGGVGKSTFCKFLLVRYGAMLLSGKASDMKYAIASRGVYPDIVVVDCPRSNKDFLSYTGIEEIKNGMFFAGKYESKQIVGNNPHMIVFSNFEPDYEKLSQDRWIVEEIKK